MENANKALEMAASVLIAILIIGLIVFSYTKLSEIKQTEENSKAIEQASDFNNSYEIYNKDGAYGAEILSLANKVADYNKTTSSDGYEKIDLIIKFTSLPQNMENNRYNSVYKFSLEMTGEKLSTSYETLNKKITQKGNETLESTIKVNGSKVSKKIVQWEKISNVTLKSYFNGEIPDKIQEYKDLCDAQTDLARKVFKEPEVTYNKNNGRIIKMVFEEK